MKKCFLLLLVAAHYCLNAQDTTRLTVARIMRDPKTWMGTSPTNPFWSEDSKTIYFEWNPDTNAGDSLYKVSVQNNSKPLKVSWQERQNLSPGGVYDRERSRKLYSKGGDIFLLDTQTGNLRQITKTIADEKDPAFTKDRQRIVFTNESNLFALNLGTGQLEQLTDFKNDREKQPPARPRPDAWLEAHELSLINTLRERKLKEEQRDKARKLHERKLAHTYYLNGQTVGSLQLSPDERYITFLLRKGEEQKSTFVPNYITRSGFTEEIKSRPKVGFDQAKQVLGIYDRKRDTIYFAPTDKLSGGLNGENRPKEILANNPIWSEDGMRAAVVFRSVDTKDRWVTVIDITTGIPRVLNHQHDDAWLGGPGIGWLSGSGSIGWMPDNKRLWFQSEESGYSHLYTVHTETGQKHALTSGAFEVNRPIMSRDKKHWYFEANREHPGDYQLYYMPLEGGTIKKITTMTGRSNTLLSPDEKKISILYSSSNQPWELFVMDNPLYSRQAVPTQLTHSLKDEFKAYPWRKPEVIRFQARDSVYIHARLYKPANVTGKAPAVVFVHGAGYLQNAHMWWSSYFREYMFHNLLADKGYYVLDIDYRGSAGYGSGFRTGIYRHMGGKDLSDHIDGVRYLVEHYPVDKEKIGIYGGSYGGFITLMAMFTESETFAAGAALRAVTDWSHYNHPYTSGILNTPVEDSVAFTVSSPIQYAEGLKKPLLICHGMVDTNVHFQDVVRLTQRLIELGKDNWELALYPMEDHSFVESSSWTDEYKRILKLFETHLK